MKKEKRKTVHVVAATVFTVVTFIHALRIANGWPVIIGDVLLPMWLSWVIVLLTGTLATLLWMNSR